MGINRELEIGVMASRVKNMLGLGLDDDTIISILGITKEDFEEAKIYLENK